VKVDNIQHHFFVLPTSFMETTPAYRKIIHIDMDAFYASIEQRDHPEYRGKPIAVGGSPQGRGGVVATASYEARKYGVRSAMSSKKAAQLCPEVIFIRPRFDVYKDVSNRIRAIFQRYTDLIEPLSLDEAFLDVTHDKLGIGSAIEIATLIRQAIKDELQLTASAGVSINKFVAKIASDMNKPDGLTFIGPSRIESFMEKLAVE
jgi:DNA polymerase-4